MYDMTRDEMKGLVREFVEDTTRGPRATRLQAEHDALVIHAYQDDEIELAAGLLMLMSFRLCNHADLAFEALVMTYAANPCITAHAQKLTGHDRRN